MIRPPTRILRKGLPEPDPDLRDQENVPLPIGFIDLDKDAQAKSLIDSAEEYLEREIRPYVPDAWIDHAKTKIGYEIPFTRQFYVYEPPRPVEEIAAEIRDLEEQIQGWMKGLGLMTTAWHSVPLWSILRRHERTGEPDAEAAECVSGLGGHSQTRP